ncbi:MAG: SDR family oxidoreductase [Proteobacteria bacterium]|nr:SDR family oxidoreductase [Pseudomonadota bacterium]MDA1136540.1 SDR family oxidoreductase [Pseudomonadota bacterium]
MINKNQTILVTASAKRLGKHISTDLVKSGWNVALHYNQSKIIAEETAHYLTIIGGKVTLHQADLSKLDQVTKLINNVKKLNSQWVGLINNAGLFKYDDGINFDFKNLNDHMSVNFTAPAILTQALARVTIEKQKQDKKLQGIVINILDAKIFGLNPDYYSYTLSKQALYGLTKMSALSYASSIRVNGIAPGITLPAPGQDKNLFEYSHKQNLLKSSATIEEILNAIQFLIKSKSVTGHVTLLDGGAHLAPPRRDVGL